MLAPLYKDNCWEMDNDCPEPRDKVELRGGLCPAVDNNDYMMMMMMMMITMMMTTIMMKCFL